MGLFYPNSSILMLADNRLGNKVKGQVKELGLDFILVQSIELVAQKLRYFHASLIIIDADYQQFDEMDLMLLLKKYPSARNVPILMLINSRSSTNQNHMEEFQSLTVLDKSDKSFNLANSLEKILEPSIKVRFWGVRGSTPCANTRNMKYGGNTTCVQIESPSFDELLIMDSGTGIRNLGNEIDRFGPDSVRGHIFVTHPHWDHIQGFPFFKPLYSKSNRFVVHMPEQYRGKADEILAGHMSKTFFPVTLDMFNADIEYVTQSEEKVSYGNYSIDYMVANHPTKTAMYRIHIGGYVIVFAPDNELNDEPTPIRYVDKFKQFISGCDLLIHDGQFNRKSYKDREGWGHSAWENVVDIAKDCNVKRLYLSHHDPDSDDFELDDVSAKLENYNGKDFQDLQLAREGSFVDLPLQKPHQNGMKSRFLKKS